jgi:hypothetical protein
VYPVWENCDKFTLCINGVNIELSCTSLGHVYFNPTTKMCEDGASSTNSCLFRSYSLLNYNPSVTG